MLHRFTIIPVALFLSATCLCHPASASPPSDTREERSRDDWKPLFNGKDLSGWHLVLTSDHKGIDPEMVFQVHDGVLHAYRDVPQGVEVPIGYLVTEDSYSSYHLKLEYRWGDKRFAPRTDRPRDAGVLYHASAEKKVWPRSVECQIQEKDVGDCFTVHGARVETTVNPKKLKSGVYQYLPATDGGVAVDRGGPGIARVIKKSTHEVDGWNTVEVIVRGDEEAIYIVNGHEVFRCKNLKQLDADGQTWIPLASGRLLLQAEFAEVMYRNVQIKPLDDRPFRVAESPQSGRIHR